MLLVIAMIAPFFKPAIFPLFSVIGLFFPLLWIINIAFIIIFMTQKSKLWLVALVLLIGGIYQASLILNFSANNDRTANSVGIKLITYNTGSNDSINDIEGRKQTFNNPEFMDCDIVCLQEFTPRDEKGIEVLEAFKHNINVSYFGFPKGHSNGLSVYTNYEILDYDWLKQNNEDTYALWCDLIVGMDTVKLINVQLQSIRLEDEELESMTELQGIGSLPGNIVSIFSKLRRGFVWRTEQVENLKGLIANSEYSVVLCGDFNDPPSSYTYREFSKLLEDAFMEKGNGFDFTYAGSLPLLRIDYVLTSNNIEILTYKRIDETFSDHYPLVVELGDGLKRKEKREKKKRRRMEEVGKVLQK